MRLSVIGLLTLLSSVAFFGTPGSAMQDEHVGRVVRQGSKVKKEASEEQETAEVGVRRSGLKEFLSKQDYSGAFSATKTAVPHVSDEEIVNFLMASNKYPGWDTVDPNTKGWVVSKITKEAKRKDLESFLSQQDYSGAFSATKTAVPHVSDEEIVNFLMTSNKYPGWDTVDSGTKGWVVSKIAKAAKRKDLENFLSKQDYSGAFRSTKADLPHVSDTEIVTFLMTSNAYPGWDTVDSDTKRWVVSKITGKPIPPPRAPKPHSRVSESEKAASAIPIPPPPPPFDPSFKEKRKSSAKKEQSLAEKEQKWSPPPRSSLSKRDSATAGMSKDAFELLQERLKLINRDVSDDDTYESEDKDLPAPPPSSSPFMASEVAPKVKTFDEIIDEKRQEVENINLNIQALKETAEKRIPSGFSRAIKAESTRILNARQAVKDEKDRLISLRFEIERLEQQKIQQEREAVEEAQRSIEKAQRIAEAHRKVLASSVSDEVGEFPPQAEQLARVQLKKSPPSSKRISTVESPASAAASSSTADSMSAFLKKAEALRSKKETEDDNGDDWD
ncbi:MAG: hypothetical protein JSR85_05055 [Proteobacteria bacterium]|nr:hypothetical protein [Pseudomonadota bacterium]